MNNLEHLKKKLTKEGFRLAAANINGEGAHDGLFIVARNSKWLVFYEERGTASEVSKHVHESCACWDFFERAMKDLGTGKKYYSTAYIEPRI